MALTFDTSKKLVNFFRKHLLFLIIASFVFIVSTSVSTTSVLKRFKANEARPNSNPGNYKADSSVLGDGSQFADLPILK